MAYVLSDDEDLIRKTVREFAATQIGLDEAAELDRHDRFPEQILQAAAGLGLTAMGLSAEEGGAGISPTAFALAIDEIARIDSNTAAILALHNGLGLRLLRAASDDLKGRVLPGIIAGEVLSVLATEEAAGSDTKGIGTRAEATGDGFTLTGQKAWGLGAAGAKHFLVLAKVTPSDDHPGGGTLFYVPAGAPGFTLGRGESLLGLRASGIRNAYLSSVEVPAENVVGEIGQGFDLLEAARPWLKVAAAAALCGCTDGAFVAARDFAESRVQFGKPIGTYQAVSDAVTTMDIQVAAARALTLQAAAWLDVDDDKAALAAARAKAFAAEMAIPMTRKAIRVMGGTGFMREGVAERFLRDARALQYIGETVQMQREILKRSLVDIDFPAP